jgi:hypothetical protein
VWRADVPSGIDGYDRQNIPSLSCHCDLEPAFAVRVHNDSLSGPCIGNCHTRARFNTASFATHTDLSIPDVVDFDPGSLNCYRRHGIQGESDVKTTAICCSVGRNELKDIEAFLQRDRSMGKAKGRLNRYFLTVQSQRSRLTEGSDKRVQGLIGGGAVRRGG